MIDDPTVRLILAGLAALGLGLGGWCVYKTGQQMVVGGWQDLGELVLVFSMVVLIIVGVAASTLHR